MEVDGLLLQEVFEGLNGVSTDELYAEASLAAGGSPALRVRVMSASGSVEVSWAPDLDDYATLRMASSFAELPCLSLQASKPPDTRGIVSEVELPAATVPDALAQAASGLQSLANDMIQNGMRPERLRSWAELWEQIVNSSHGFDGGPTAEAIATAGCVHGPREEQARTVAMGPFGPMKAEWLSQYLDAGWSLIDDAIAGIDDGDDAMAGLAFDTGAQALTSATSSHVPALLRLESADRPLLPSRESRVWTVFGGVPQVVHYESQARDALGGIISRLLRLQPEAAGHLKVLAFGEGSADLALIHAVGLAGSRVEGAEVRRIEIFAVGNRPSDATLRSADEHQLKREGQETIELRYFDRLEDAAAMAGSGEKKAHLAVVTGLTGQGTRLQVDTVDVATPAASDESLFAPRLWQRPDKSSALILLS